MVSGGTSSSISVSVAGSYWLKATNNCGSASSLAAIVTICTLPSIRIQPRNASGTFGNPGVLVSVSADGANLTYQWYAGASGVITNPVIGATTSSVVLTPTATQTYWVRVSNACGSINSTAATITMYAAPTAPTNLKATYDPVTSKIHLTWTAGTAPAGLHYYQIYRTGGLNFSAQSTGTSYDDSSISPKFAYSYRLLTFDLNGAYSSQYSNTDVAVAMTFTDGTCVSPTQGLHRICGDHIAQLRQAVDAVRNAAALDAHWGTVGGTYPRQSGKVGAIDILDLRSYLSDARFVLKLPTLLYAEPNLDTHSKVKFGQIDELRSAVQ
jgi:hypothetical protein